MTRDSISACIRQCWSPREEGDKTSEDTEALVICFETSMGNVFMNVALHFGKQRMANHAIAGD